MDVADSAESTWTLYEADEWDGSHPCYKTTVISIFSTKTFDFG